MDKPFRDKTALTTEQQMPKPVDSIDTLLRERLLLDCGNDRKNAAVVEALKKRPKSILLNETQKETKQSQVYIQHKRSILRENVLLHSLTGMKITLTENKFYIPSF